MSPTSRVALCGPSLVAFLLAHEEMKESGHPRRTRRFINNILVTPDTDGRIMRRWDSGTTVTKAAAARLLQKFNLTLGGFAAWCEDTGHTTTIRGTI